ncbi:MAG TPA: DNA recombination protein RmuC [bacterium]|nr:DNA recombination protein RmuC [bacterium]
MDSSTLAFIVGTTLGAVGAWLVARTVAVREGQRAAQLERELAEARREQAEAAVRAAELRKALEADQEKLRWVERAEQALRESFQALAAEALRTNAESLAGRVLDQLQRVLAEARGDWQAERERVGRLVEPLGQALAELDREIKAVEQKREGAYHGLQEQLRQLAEAQAGLQSATFSLNQALKSTATRGRWGEYQLRRIVELAGLMEHVDFSEQVTVEAGRPDLVVHLPNGGVIPVDAKAPMQAYLEAVETGGAADRAARLDAHVRALKQHVQQLAAKRYWEQLGRAVDVTVMFVPNEAALSAAFERDPGLLEFAIQQRVLLASPITLLGLLKAVAYGWQQHRIAESARAFADQGRQVYERLRTFLQSFAELGRRLDSAAKHYNEASGALERRVLPAARRLGELGAATDPLPEPPRVERELRVLPEAAGAPDGQA